MKKLILLGVIGAYIVLTPGVAAWGNASPVASHATLNASSLSQETVYSILKQAALDFYPNYKVTADELVAEYRAGDCCIIEEGNGFYRVESGGFAVIVVLSGF